MHRFVRAQAPRPAAAPRPAHPPRRSPLWWQPAAARLATLLVAAAGLWAAPAAAARIVPAQASAPPAAAVQSAPAAISAALRAGIVRVDTRAVAGAASVAGLGSRRSGSGVILDGQLVLTIGYLLLEADAVEVTTASGRRIPGTVAGYDHATGFGLVRTVLPLDGRPIELGDSDAVVERQMVLTIGQGEDEATALHVISRKPFAGSWEYLLERPIYTFPPVNNWSGAALTTEDGRLVGIGSLVVNDAALERRGVPGNLFVPVNLLKPILEDLVRTGRRQGPAQAWLGLSTEPLRGHLMVVRVSRDGPAEAAGIEPGDIVVAVDGERFADQATFYRRLWRLGPAGTEVTLRLLRDGALRDVKVRSIDRTEVLARPSGI